MNTCKIPNCESIELVYSGVDAMVLGGIPTEQICYACANTYAQVSRIRDAWLADVVNA